MKSRSADTYFFLVGLADVGLPPEDGFPGDDAGFFFAAGLLVLGFGVAFDADFAVAVAFAFVAGAADFAAEAVFPCDLLITLLAAVPVAAGATFFAASALTGFTASFGAGGFTGFFFGGNCNSANRSMTLSMDCSESA